MTGERGWQIERLGELVEFKTGKLDSNAAVPGGTYPFFTCSQETLRTNTYSFDTECVLLAGNNANGIYPLKYFNGKFDAYQRTYVVTTRDPSRLVTRFLYYLLRPKLSEFRSVSTGAATKFLTLTILKETEIAVPPPPVQRRITDILSAYDDLIENNLRRIRILEEMVRTLYSEWFVHFRFPGHETVPRVASSLGPIPQGWEGLFGNLAAIERDGINPFEFPGEEFEHFSIPAFDDGQQPAIELGETILSGKYRIDASCVLLSKLNPRIPRIWMPQPSRQHRAITSTEFLVLKPRLGVTREFIYAKCCSEEFAGQFASLAIGTSTSHQRVKPENLLAMPSTTPDRATIERFSSVVGPMLVLSQQLRAKTQNLRRTRDLLLPRLIEGKVALASELDLFDRQQIHREGSA